MKRTSSTSDTQGGRCVRVTSGGVRCAVSSLLAGIALSHAFGGVSVRQVMREPRYARGDENVRIVQEADRAAWIWMPGHEVYGVAAYAEKWKKKAERGEVPGWFFRFRNDFDSDGSTLRLDVTADERFELILDGRPIARGPERGMVEHWYYHSYEITGLEPGSHRLEAVCGQLLTAAPLAQLSHRGGFLLKAEGAYDAALTTGKGPWRVAPLKGTVMTDRGTSQAIGAGSQCRVTGTGLAREEPPSDAWRPPEVVRAAIGECRWWEREPGWMLFPADRPDQLYAPKTPGRVVNVGQDFAKPFTVPAHAERDFWWDLGDYYCGYPLLDVSGGAGAVVTWGWTESLRDERDRKGNRSAWKGKRFAHTLTDTFVVDGRSDAAFSTPWWRCGRWCRVTVKTADAPLEVKRIAFAESRYPLAVDADFACDDATINAIFALSRRTMECCAHEMLFDCPYYEQQMYPGDTRIQMQILNALTSDARLARFAMSVYDWNRRDSGLVAMNFPTRALQESCTYAMCWVMMFADHLMWRGDLDFLRLRMPGVRHTLTGLARYENADGLLEKIPGWSFTDWVDDWPKERPDFPTGCAPDVEPHKGISSLNNLQYLLALQSAAKVDRALGETAYAAIWEDKAARLTKALRARFLDAGRGLVADTVRKDLFSEHGQAMGILTGVIDPNAADRALAALATEGTLVPASTYFSHYVFEALAKCGRGDVILRRLGYWKNFLDWGASTAFEKQQADSRSDCHAWSASPIYFLQSVIAGVRPAAPGFARVRIAPQPGGLKRIRTTVPTPRGKIAVDLRFEGGEASGSVVLPPDLEGDFVWKGASRRFGPGTNDVAAAQRPRVWSGKDPSAWKPLEVQIRSTADGSLQPSFFHLPTRRRPGEKVPLLVCLHTWSCSYTTLNPAAWGINQAEKRGWAFLYPHFRGPNWTPSACGSDLAVQDIVDAVKWAIAGGHVDPDRVYLIGASGGGHMALLQAGRHPELWAAVYAACPPADLKRWHAECLAQPPGNSNRSYAKNIEDACGGTPAERPEEYAHRSATTHLSGARDVPIQISTGIHDGHVFKGSAHSVPPGQSVRCFNLLAAPQDRIGEEDIAVMERDERVPDPLLFHGRDPFFAPGALLFNRISRNVRLTLHSGGHAGNFAAAIAWFEDQRRGRPVTWAVKGSSDGTLKSATR